MKKDRMFKLVAMVGFLFAVMGGSLFANEAGPVYPIFFDDFSQDEIGGLPGKWTLSNADGEFGNFEVIEAPELESGKALRVTVNTSEGKDGRAVNVAMRFPWGSLAENARIVIIDHKVRRVEGRGEMYSYVTQGTNRLMWYVRPTGVLTYTIGGGLSDSVPVAEGWNHVRLIADRANDQVFVYVNDMETPAMGPHPFLRPMDSWSDANLIFSHWTNPRESGEIHYGDFSILVME